MKVKGPPRVSLSGCGLQGRGGVSPHGMQWSEWLLSPACFNSLYHWALVLTQLFAPIV